MPFVLIFAGAVLLAAAVRNTHTQLFALLKGDFSGPANFIYWVISILILGAIGYIPKVKPISDAFLILLIVVLFLTKGTGFFDMFQKQIATTETYKSVFPSIGGGGGLGPVQPGGGGISIGGNVGGVGIGVGSGGVGINVPTIRI